ncbi:hypothetical protein SAMN05518670_5540 [Paenibacillus sp. OK076]|nr:hypothetical protein SAMN05518670_5540 [Paenibacillus sp. OK076]
MVRRSISFGSTTSQSRRQGEYPSWDVLKKASFGKLFCVLGMRTPMVRRSISFGGSTTSQSRRQGEYPSWDVLKKASFGKLFLRSGDENPIGSSEHKLREHYLAVSTARRVSLLGRKKKSFLREAFFCVLGMVEYVNRLMLTRDVMLVYV